MDRLNAIKQNEYLLKDIDIQTYEICEFAVKKNGYMIEHVRLQTPKLCEIAVTQNGDALKYVKIQTPKICEIAVNQYYYAIQYVVDQTPELCRLAVTKWPWTLRHVKNQTPDICLLAVKININTLDLIKDVQLRNNIQKILDNETSLDDICIEFINDNPTVEEYLSNKQKDILCSINLTKPCRY